MKANDAVVYVDDKGKRHAARVAGVPGTGASRNKTLNLTLSDGRFIADVAHEADKTKGAGYWSEVGAAPAGKADSAEAPKPKRRPKGKK